MSLSRGLRFINIGFGNIVAVDRVIAVISNDSAPVKRMIQDARDGGHLVDATCGRRTRAVMVTDSGQIVLSAIQPETIAGRLNTRDAERPLEFGERD